MLELNLAAKNNSKLARVVGSVATSVEFTATTLKKDK
jgi:hypothetical protein